MAWAPEWAPKFARSLDSVTMWHHATGSVARPLTCGNARNRVGPGGRRSGRFRAGSGLRIRRLGVRIPSGAHCVETVKRAPASGNAVGALLCPRAGTARTGAWAPRIATGRPRRILSNPAAQARPPRVERTEMATAQRYVHAVDELRHEAARRMGVALWESPRSPWPAPGQPAHGRSG